MAQPLLSRPRMNVSLYEAASAMNAHSRWQEVIANNLASGSTPSSQKQFISFAGVEASAASGAAKSHVIPTAVTTTKFQTGVLRPTGVQTDLGIEGNGFFEVEQANGTKAYTRDGELHLNAQSQLVTKQGLVLQGESGPIQMDVTNPAPISVAVTGEVSQGSEVKGRLKMVEFNQPDLLTPIGADCYVPNDPTIQSTPSTASRVRQGYLEGSNTSPMGEMSSLITAMRMFETNQHVIQMQDERMGKVISDLGTPAA